MGTFDNEPFLSFFFLNNVKMVNYFIHTFKNLAFSKKLNSWAMLRSPNDDDISRIMLHVHLIVRS